MDASPVGAKETMAHTATNLVIHAIFSAKSVTHRQSDQIRRDHHHRDNLIHLLQSISREAAQE
jgi:hypothetical protein